jgi:hypothetical protein
MVLMLHCVSTFSQDAPNTTVIHACPNSVRYEYHVVYRSPEDVARIKHLLSLPRDDRAAAEQVQKLVKKKPTGKKRVAKRRKRR